MAVSIRWGITARRDGNARNPARLSRILRERYWPRAAATAEQIHGVRIACVGSLKEARRFAGVDGLLTDVVRQPLVIFTADCVPVFLSARGGEVVGVLHAGWRGTRGNILRQAVRILRRRWSVRPGQIRFWTGPAIGPCCYEVGWDVARHFARTRRRRGARWTIDLTEEVRRQGASIGLRWDAARARRACTGHQKQYHSYRRDRTESRQASLIMKDES